VIEPQRLRRLLARASLVGGLTLGAVHLLPAVPREQTLEFRLPAEVARLDASWRRAGETEVVGGVTLRPEGPPRRRLRHQVALPNGLYELTVSLEPAGTEATGAQTSFVRRVRLEGGTTPVVLSDSSS